MLLYTTPITYIDDITIGTSVDQNTGKGSWQDLPSARPTVVCSLFGKLPQEKLSQHLLTLTGSHLPKKLKSSLSKLARASEIPIWSDLIL